MKNCIKRRSNSNYTEKSIRGSGFIGRIPKDGNKKNFPFFGVLMSKNGSVKVYLLQSFFRPSSFLSYFGNVFTLSLAINFIQGTTVTLACPNQPILTHTEIWMYNIEIPKNQKLPFLTKTKHTKDSIRNQTVSLVYQLNFG